MKQIISICCILLLISCDKNTKKSSENPNNSIQINQKNEHRNFDWLVGSWKRTNEKKDRETFEKWWKINKNKYNGIGFTIQNGDTIKQEKISILFENNHWNLIVNIPNLVKERFMITKITQNSFISINDSIDFPNKIQYWKKGEKLEALVSNDSLKIPFEFVKL